MNFIGEFVKAKVNNRVFVKLDSRYDNYFTEYSGYFGRALRLLKYMYGMSNSKKLLSNELIDWLAHESGFKTSQCQMSIYYKYAPDEKHFILSIGIHIKLMKNSLLIL